MNHIRPYKEQDLDAVLSAWESASKLAHPFLPEEFQNQLRKDIPALYLPKADTWVLKIEGQAQGFIALLGDEIGAIFLHLEHQGKRLGKMMMDKAQELHGDLEVEVFERNSIGRAFYDSYGFKLLERKVHAETNENLLRLKFEPSN
ncbi:MAG: putative acetyltransferase [Cryomorphaceae bacterium]|jgi:putative acetyltransferase